VSLSTSAFTDRGARGPALVIPIARARRRADPASAMSTTPALKPAFLRFVSAYRRVRWELGLAGCRYSCTDVFQA
jgi:hypothetical protein